MKSRVTVKGGVSALIFGICLSVIGTGLYGTARAADWPNYRGPDYNGITNETDWKSNWGDSGPKVLWKKSVGIGFSSVTVADGRAYAMGNTGKRGNTDIVFCFDAVISLPTGGKVLRGRHPLNAHCRRQQCLHAEQDGQSVLPQRCRW
ncbi:MAG: hypothetical protein ACYSWQ_05840 [Planctomycetota bacterium]|jgi:hypothetical protein